VTECSAWNAERRERRFVSRAVTDLVAGAGIAFQPRGTHMLKGVPGDWEVFAIAG
jgi:hypothetical protein